LLLVILAGANATSFHPARTTRRRRGDGGGVALVVRGVAKEGTKDDVRSCAARLVTTGA